MSDVLQSIEKFPMRQQGIAWDKSWFGKKTFEVFGDGLILHTTFY